MFFPDINKKNLVGVMREGGQYKIVLIVLMGDVFIPISLSLGFLTNPWEFSALRALSKMIIDILVTGTDSSRVLSLIRSTTGTFVIP